MQKWRVKKLQFKLGRGMTVTVAVRRRNGGTKPVLKPQHFAVLANMLVIVGLVVVYYFAFNITHRQGLEPPKKQISTLVQPKVVSAVKVLSASVPVHLSIPAVGIDTDIMPVGLTSDGSIQLPPVLEWVTGWYKYSPTPGQLGPAIIVGHVDSYKNISVFWRLRELQVGNDIFITRADGSSVHFKATSLKQVPQANFPTQEVYGNINYPGLRLITCGGTFNTASDSYDQNTVVFAAMVS